MPQIILPDPQQVSREDLESFVGGIQSILYIDQYTEELVLHGCEVSGADVIDYLNTMLGRLGLLPKELPDITEEYV